ncbi:YdaS family helix-turn-helix protein [Agrobacterium sp. CCNWLW71]|uniref:transcriptional regulator n=1 Tax=unclassified Agrobacterium TaxID=2632611 RepID=UPI002FF1C0D9
MIDVVRKGAEKAGGVVSLARELGIKHPSLYRWPRVPAGRVLAFERITGISRHEIRPDVYGPEESVK